MSFSINAWIDRISPFISILNAETGEEVVRFDGEVLESHVERGNIYMSDFYNPNSRERQILIMDLLLLRCYNATYQET